MRVGDSDVIELALKAKSISEVGERTLFRLILLVNIFVYVLDSELPRGWLICSRDIFLFEAMVGDTLV